MTAEKRFWNKVEVKDKDSCWNWKGFVNPKTGYGQFWDGEKSSSPHRFSLELKLKRKLKGKVEWSLHKCDNKTCVNPNHLFLGDALKNSQDMFQKGRQKVVTCVTLTAELVVKIRKQYADGKLLNDLARKYKVDPGTIWHAIRGKTWKSAGGLIQTTDMRKKRSGGNQYA